MAERHNSESPSRDTGPTSDPVSAPESASSPPNSFPPPGYEEVAEPPASPWRACVDRLRDLTGDGNVLTSGGLRTGVLICALAVFVAGGAVVWARSGADPDPTDEAIPEPAAASNPAPASVAPEDSEPSGDGTVIVHVGGDVLDPGLVELPDGARVADAVEEAGGLTDDADTEAVDALNLARRLTDGEQILVGSDLPPAQGPAGGTEGGDLPIDLNTATVDQLEELPGVGPVLAQAIVDYRDDNGGFSSVDELQEVSGIGEKRMEDLQDRVLVHSD